MSSALVVELPQSETLVAINPAAVRALLVDHRDRLRKRKRRELHVQRTPASGRDVSVSIAVDECGRHQISRAAALEIANRRVNIGEREMHERIATENEISARQFIGREVETAKLSRITRGVFANESLDDIDAGVLDIEIVEHEPHPIEVAARRIENRFDLDIAQNF